MLLAAAPAHAAISSVADDPTWTVDENLVEAFAPDGDRVWVGGDFLQAVARSGPGVAIDASGNRVAGFAELTDSTGGLRVDAAIRDGGSGWYVAGTFNKAGGTDRPGLVHLKPDGTLDSAFNAQATAGTVKALALTGSTLYVGGSFTSIGGATRTSLAALNAATGAATNWVSNLNAGGTVSSIAVDASFAWVGGQFTSVGGTALTNAAKVSRAAGPQPGDATWLPNPNNDVRAIVVTATDVYLAGRFTTVNGTTSAATSHLSKVDRINGAPDAAWLPNVTGTAIPTVNALVTDGTTLYAGGSFTSLGGQARAGVGATPLATAGGGLATAWNPGALQDTRALALAGGLVYIGGVFMPPLGAPRANVAAASAGGTGALQAWDPRPTDDVYAVAANGTTVYAGGIFKGIGGFDRQSLMALDLNTGAPTGFTHTFDNPVHTITVCGDTVYVGGVFFTIDGQNRFDAAAFDRNTGALLPWDPSPDGDVWSIACVNGAVYLAGQFIKLDYRGVGTGVTRNGLAAVDPVTGALLPWDPAGTSAPIITSMAVSGNTIYVGGGMTDLVNGTVPRNGVAAIDATNGAVLPFNPNVAGNVQSIALNGTSSLYVAGGVTSVGGAVRTRVAEVDLGTGAPTAFDPAPDNFVQQIARAPDGTVYMAGSFANVGGVPRRGVAAVDSAGTVTSWNPKTDGDGWTVVAGSDGRIYAGGQFQGGTERASHGLLTFSEPTSFATPPSLTSAPIEAQSTTCDPGTAGGSLPAQQTIQWQLDGVPIAGAVGPSYTPTTGDVGHSLSCRVSQRNLTTNAQADAPPATVSAAPVPPAAPAAPFDIDGFATPPPAKRGESVIAQPIKGTVTVLLPGFKRFIPLPDAERIPVGTVIDTRSGTVKLTSVGKSDKPQSAIFYDGLFQVFQGKGKNAITELRLYGGNFAVCKKAKRSSLLAKAQKIPKSKSIRHLWGNGKGLFRTKGRYASATIRGTTWLTDDRCDGTLVRVKVGSVTVRDFPRRKSLVLKAPKQYLAKAK